MSKCNRGVYPIIAKVSYDLGLYSGETAIQGNSSHTDEELIEIAKNQLNRKAWKWPKVKETWEVKERKPFEN